MCVYSDWRHAIHRAEISVSVHVYLYSAFQSSFGENTCFNDTIFGSNEQSLALNHETSFSLLNPSEEFQSDK